MFSNLSFTSLAVQWHSQNHYLVLQGGLVCRDLIRLGHPINEGCVTEEISSGCWTTGMITTRKNKFSDGTFSVLVAILLISWTLLVMLLVMRFRIDRQSRWTRDAKLAFPSNTGVPFGASTRHELMICARGYCCRSSGRTEQIHSFHEKNGLLCSEWMKSLKRELRLREQRVSANTRVKTFLMRWDQLNLLLTLNLKEGKGKVNGKMK